MFKVNILDTCSYCHGKAYLPAGEATNWKGEKFIRHTPCPVCEGSGNQPKCVSLTDFAELLKHAQCKHEHTAFRGGTHFSAGDVWDDTEEICTDWGLTSTAKTWASKSQMTTNFSPFTQERFPLAGRRSFYFPKGESQ